MPLPNVLIIGAMKAGTTSLYMDLCTHELAHFVGDKEPGALCSDEVLNPEGMKRYEAIYAKARPDQLRCDASTAYSKRPDMDGVADRAVRVLPEGFKVIYLVRHPVDRIISQHHHELIEGRVGPCIDEEVRRHARYVHYSRYNYQLAPWLSAIGRDRVRVIRFEDYASQRQSVVDELFKFLEMSPVGESLDQGKVYNRSEGKPVKTRFWHALQHNSYYQKWVRPLTPWKMRLAVRRMLLPKAPQRPAAPSADTLAFLQDELREDVQQLSATLGLPAPLWEGFAADAAEPPVATARKSDTTT